ncbi:DUF1003 domain-containing protein [Brucella grignonensis]|uniref:DUF1003 domain-containing protein n=1 Tax=Brucella grignonensis TaxID=94627 RepID=A0A256FRG9_9HYPH|nr:DUF1003 domain-containing protein [Brucella grignonensis]NKB84036.1 DUF1003 domain-containing protein [Brucella grignonensis]OYR17465.1 hypothetical protein CEV33_3922 [Brucella grignonensis]
MNNDVQQLAEHLLQTGYDDLPAREQRVLRRMAKRVAISENINETFHERLTLGQRLADKVAAFGGSWTFIISFGVILAIWVVMNTIALPGKDVFDPYPFVFLNLVLSMLAAIQAPVIMMSQNRQANKDRLAVSHDYEVNLKAELEIMQLHDKMDQIRSEQLAEILRQQQEQIRQLSSVVQRLENGPQ